MFKKFLILILFVFGMKPAFSHPTSFEDSFGVMGHHAPQMVHNQLNYSWKYWLATGIHHFRRPDFDDARHATFASGNFLLKRWNSPRFQANLYGILGAGQSELSGIARPSALSLLQFDIEDRRYYFLTKHLRIDHDKGNDLNQSVVRFGVAPYEGDYDELNTWIILEYQSSEFDKIDRMEDLSPFLRLFYNNILFEIGQSFKGVTRFNYISHF